MSIKIDAERGARAARVLSEPIFSEAFASVETAIHDAWAQSPVRDLEGQQQLRLMLKLLGDVRAFLETAVSDGKIAVDKINEINRRVISPAQWSGR